MRAITYGVALCRDREVGDRNLIAVNLLEMKLCAGRIPMWLHYHALWPQLRLKTNEGVVGPPFPNRTSKQKRSLSSLQPAK